MLLSLLSGTIMGFLVSLPPLGPVFFAIMSKGLKSEHNNGLTLAIGAAFVDTFYALTGLTGISLLLSFLPGRVLAYYEANEQFVAMVLSYASGLFVIGYGIKIILHKHQDPPQYQAAKQFVESHGTQRTKDEEINTLQRFSFLSVFKQFSQKKGRQIIAGATLAFSSVTLPASWFAIVGVLKSHHFIDISFISGATFCAGVFLGTYLWFFTMLELIAYNKHRIGASTLNKLHFVSGMMLNVLGVILLIHAFQTPFVPFNSNF